MLNFQVSTKKEEVQYLLYGVAVVAFLFTLRYVPYFFIDIMLYITSLMCFIEAIIGPAQSSNGNSGNAPQGGAVSKQKPAS